METLADISLFESLQGGAGCVSDLSVFNETNNMVSCWVENISYMQKLPNGVEDRSSLMQFRSPVSSDRVSSAQIRRGNRPIAARNGFTKGEVRALTEDDDTKLVLQGQINDLVTRLTEAGWSLDSSGHLQHKNDGKKGNKPSLDTIVYRRMFEGYLSNLLAKSMIKDGAGQKDGVSNFYRDKVKTIKSLIKMYQEQGGLADLDWGIRKAGRDAYGDYEKSSVVFQVPGTDRVFALHYANDAELAAYERPMTYMNRMLKEKCGLELDDIAPLEDKVVSLRYKGQWGNIPNLDIVTLRKRLDSGFDNAIHTWEETLNRGGDIESMGNIFDVLTGDEHSQEQLKRLVSDGIVTAVQKMKETGDASSLSSALASWSGEDEFTSGLKATATAVLQDINKEMAGGQEKKKKGKGKSALAAQEEKLQRAKNVMKTDLFKSLAMGKKQGGEATSDDNAFIYTRDIGPVARNLQEWIRMAKIQPEDLYTGMFEWANDVYGLEDMDWA